MLRRIVTGGQTGADQGAWRAARALGVDTGGWMPRGFLTEDGPRPELADRFGAIALESDAYDDRTRANVRDSDGTLVFASENAGPGTRRTIDACRAIGRPLLIVDPEHGGEPSPEDAAAWIEAQGLRVLHVAGDRESVAPGIGSTVEAYVERLLRAIRPHI